MQYNIRPLQPDDLDSLLALIQEHADYERSPVDLSDHKARLAKAIFSTKKLYCWVVEHNKTIEGFVSFTFDYATWDAAYFIHMDCLYLREHIRGFGIGQEILKRLRLLATQRDFKNVQWQTPEFNTRAIRFYEKNHAKSFRKVRFVLDSGGGEC